MYTMLKLRPALIFLAAAILWTVPAGAEPVRVGLVIDGPWAGNDETASLFQNEIIALTRGEFDVEFPDEFRLVGDWTTEACIANLDRLMKDPKCDMILAMGVISSYRACLLRKFSKPVIAPFIIDPVMQQVPVSGGTSGVRNLSYLVSPFNVQRDLETFYDIHPFRHLVVFSNGPYFAALPLLEERMEQAAAELGVDIRYVPIDYNQPGNVEKALASITEETDAVYLTGMMQLTTAEFDTLIAGINARRLPSFSLLGKRDVERGVLFGVSSDQIFPKFARRVALHVQRILRGENAGDLRVAFSGGERLAINMRTARSIGVLPSWDVLTEAELVNEERRAVAETWSLDRAMREALRVNLTLKVVEQQVAVAQRDVDEARSPLLPQLEVSGTGLVVNEEAAGASFGSQPERSVVGRASVTQVIYSENAWIPYRAQKHGQHAVEYDRDAERLNAGLEAAQAFFDVLRAKTSERIARDNLRLTRENLETARVRHSVGMGGPEEVYRWESNMATGRAQVINANARRNVSEIEFNRVLRRPLEESFATEEIGIDDPLLLSDQGDVRKRVGDPLSFKTFRAFMAQEALHASPELRAIDAQIAAQSSIRSGTGRSFIVPDVALFGDVSHFLWKDGAGSEPPALFPGIGDTRWNVGIQATLPLFAGGQRVAQRGRATEEMRRLELTRADVAQRVEQRVRSAIHFMGASSAGIKHTRDAAAAAHRNLDVVTDQYARGVVSIISLLDAQNSTFRAEQEAADALYDFFQDLMEVERSVGDFLFLAPDGERNAFRQRMDAYFEAHASRSNQ